MPKTFPYLPVASGRSDAALMPVLPLQLQFKNGEVVSTPGCSTAAPQ